METKELELKLSELKTELENAATKKAKEEVAAEIKAFEEKHKEAIEGYPTLQASVIELKTIADKLMADAELNQPVIDAYVNDKKENKSFPVQKEETFNQILERTILKNADAIKNFKRGNAPLSFDMMPEVKANDKGEREVKAVGDMSAAVNFPGSGTFTQDVRQQLIYAPYNRVWLADVLPQGTSMGSSIIYPKENGGEGGAALWTDSTADKAQMDFDLTSQTAYFKWIAGYVIIAREMLDDITFLNAYLQNKMLISLKIAENDFVLNGSTDANPVDGLLDVATAYNGSYTALVDEILDAGWGQIVEDTFDFYNPTNIILTPRDAVKVGLNKATGSGEYDLPAGSVAWANGQLQVGGLDVVRTTQIGTNNFLVFDKRATMFVRRMQPELRMFEDATLAKKNKIMFRVEERATLLVFNNKAIVADIGS